MDNSYLSKSLVHNAISMGLDALADKHTPTDNSAAIIDIELRTRFSKTSSRSTNRAIGLSNGESLDSDMFWKTRHNLTVRSIKLAPGTDLLLGDWRMFGRVFKVHNGSDQPHTFRFKWYRPSIHSIKVMEGEKDGKIYDSYNWGWYLFNTKTFPVILILIFVIIMVIVTAVYKKKDTPYVPSYDSAIPASNKT